MRPAILAAILLSSVANASDWVDVGTGNDGRVYYADRETSENDGTFAWIWLKGDLSKVKTTKLRETKELWRFNCRTKKSITVTSIGYRPDGSVGLTLRTDENDTSAYQPVAPDTMGDLVMKDVCNGVASKIG